MELSKIVIESLVLAVLLPTAAHARVLTFSKSFDFSSVVVSAGTVLTYTVEGEDGPSNNLEFTDPLPAGLSIITRFLDVNTCGGRLSKSSVPGGISSISLSGGAVGSFPATCTVSVAVQADTAGVKNSTATGSGDLARLTAFATTTVIAPTFTQSLSPAIIFVGQTSALTLTLTNNIAPAVVFGAVSGFVDNLPAGLLVVNVVSNTCEGNVAADFGLITLTQSGADSLPTGSCSVVVNVTGTTEGVKVNTATGNRALNGQNPSATLNVLIPPDAFQVRYAVNLTSGDSVINLTNTGANGASLNGPGFGGAAGNICVNVYAFSPDEQLASCCSCLITPNGLASLSVNSDIISNTFTAVRPNSVVVKLVNTGAGATFTGTNCTYSAAQAGTVAFPLAGGMLAFGTTIQSPVAGTFVVTETPFLKATLSPADLASITNRCINIIGSGMNSGVTFGICRSCRFGGLGATR